MFRIVNNKLFRQLFARVPTCARVRIPAEACLSSGFQQRMERTLVKFHHNINKIPSRPPVYEVMKTMNAVWYKITSSHVYIFMFTYVYCVLKNITIRCFVFLFINYSYTLLKNAEAENYATTACSRQHVILCSVQRKMVEQIITLCQ